MTVGSNPRISGVFPYGDVWIANRAPSIQGSVTKIATLESGLAIQVPLFIKVGEKVRVHTETREFAGRA